MTTKTENSIADSAENLDLTAPLCIRCQEQRSARTLESGRWCWTCTEKHRIMVQWGLTPATLSLCYRKVLKDYEAGMLPDTWINRGRVYSVVNTLSPILKTLQEANERTKKGQALFEKLRKRNPEWEAILYDLHYLSEWWYAERFERDTQRGSIEI